MGQGGKLWHLPELSYYKKCYGRGEVKDVFKICTNNQFPKSESN